MILLCVFNSFALFFQRTLTIIFSCAFLAEYIFWQDSVAPAFQLFLPTMQTKSGTQCEIANCVNIDDRKTLRRIRNKQIVDVVSFVCRLPQKWTAKKEKSKNTIENVQVNKSGVIDCRILVSWKFKII